MSLSVGQGLQGNGLMMQSSSSFPQYEEAQGINNSNRAPQIYSAVYSTVDVYEMSVNGIAVMRRRKDSWLNATQILKVAGIEKGKRTKVLEKEILIGEHEKVQGGYGKYQGTWIKFDRGVEFCKQYGVEELLRPLLTHDMGQDGSIAGGGLVDTPTKEQALAAQRKRIYNNSAESLPNNMQTGSNFKNVISTAAHAAATINKARFDSPGLRSRNRNPSCLRNSSKQLPQQQLNNQESTIPNGSLILDQSTCFGSTEGFNAGQEIPSHANSLSRPYREDMNPEFDEPPRKRVRPSLSMTSSQPINQDENINATVRGALLGEPDESFPQSFQNLQNIQHATNYNTSIPPLQIALDSHLNAKKDLLLSLFTNSNQNDLSRHRELESLAPEDLDIPIDKTYNSALIWAATLARVDLLDHLIARGANIFRVNAAGETALMRSCLVTNNLEIGSFPKLLDLLGPTIEIRDLKGRTVLHHIAITSAVKGRSQASKYYLESLLEFVVRGSGAPFSQQPFMDDRKYTASIGIGRFMSEVVNVQDSSGDTALMIASRIGNRSIISQLIEIGADVSIPNRSHLTPADFGVGQETEVQTGSHVQAGQLGTGPRESSKDIISSMTNLLMETQSEFSAEMNNKQIIIDDLHSSLRAESGILGQRRRLLETLQAEQLEIDTRKLKINNLARACDEEKSQLLKMKLEHDQVIDENLIEVGDADKDFKINEKPSDTLSRINPNCDKLSDMTDSERNLLMSSLPSIDVLRARVNAYTSTNEALEKTVLDLKNKDSELTRKYRIIISLCTGIDENQVEESIDSLVRSLESEHDDVELGRVRKFLSRVAAT